MLNLRKTVPGLADDALTIVSHKAPAYHDRWWMSEDGLRHYARDYPAASGRVRLPVICLHGLTRNSADFEEVATWIAQADRRVIVPDFRGRGLSENDPDATNYHLWTYAKDVLALCDAFGIGQAIFVGTSMGGLVTMVLSTLRPNLIKSAVLNDVGPVLSPKGLARISTFVTEPHRPMRDWHDAAVFTGERYKASFPNHTQADWLKMAHRLFRKGRDGYLHLAYDPRITDAFKGMTLAVNHYDLAPCYASLAANRKLMLIRGGVSDLLDAAEAKKMASQCRDFTRVDIAHVGHAPDLTEPQARAALMAFLESQV
ncbi:alpha/beta hydrolase [Asticcacaulis sp. 201]|uniref:alpha/beta fold hydrolase n=1 Tax=Asticcacaulis sp. 201 TaxID=3028787 RepID=UPI002915E7DE|nr:alpha/beta hydrolase [Asticcacaulis sp. 201]MDV6331370.1 alpha/beta hydrolase [Asticcacaulis sp. 201]